MELKIKGKEGYVKTTITDHTSESKSWLLDTFCKAANVLLGAEGFDEKITVLLRSTPDLFRLVDDHKTWADNTFPGITAGECLNHLLEEVQEVKDSLNANAPEVVEYADCLMLLIYSAYRAGISLSDLLEAYREKLEINKTRTWEKKPEGHFTHVEDIAWEPGQILYTRNGFKSGNALIIQENKNGFKIKSDYGNLSTLSSQEILELFYSPHEVDEAGKPTFASADHKYYNIISWDNI